MMNKRPTPLAALVVCAGLVNGCGSEVTPAGPEAPGRATATTNYLYASTSAGIRVYRLEDTGEVVPLEGATVTGARAQYFVPHPVRSLIYAGQDERLHGFSIDRATGKLSPVPGSPFAEPGGKAAVFDASGQHLYATGGGGVRPGGIDYVPFTGNTWIYDIDPVSGALTPSAASPVDAGYEPIRLLAVPGRPVLYAENLGYSGHYAGYNPPSLSAYRIDAATGRLVAVPGSPFTNWHDGRVNAAVHPSGRFVFAAPDLDGLRTYAIDPDTGALRETSAPPAATWEYYEPPIVDPRGDLLFVQFGSLFMPDNIAVYSIDAATGRLTRRSQVPHAPGGRDIALHGTGRWLYVAEPVGIAAYALNRRTGTLVPISGSPFAVDGGVSFAVRHPLLFHPNGDVVYVPTQSGRLAAFRIDAQTGHLTALTGVTFPTAAAMAVASVQ